MTLAIALVVQWTLEVRLNLDLADLASAAGKVFCALLCGPSRASGGDKPSPGNRRRSKATGRGPRSAGASGKPTDTNAYRVLDGIKKAAAKRNYECITINRTKSVYIGVVDAGWVEFSAKTGTVKTTVYPDEHRLHRRDEIKQLRARLTQIGYALRQQGIRIARSN